MRPASTCGDSSDVLSADTKVFGDSCVGVSSGHSIMDVEDIVLRKLCSSCSGTPGLTPLDDHVEVVVSDGSQEQMSDLAAGWEVAGVADKMPIWDRPDEVLVSPAGSNVRSPLAVDLCAEGSVSVLVAESSPYTAAFAEPFPSGSYREVGEEALFIGESDRSVGCSGLLPTLVVLLTPSPSIHGVCAVSNGTHEVMVPHLSGTGGW